MPTVVTREPSAPGHRDAHSEPAPARWWPDRLVPVAGPALIVLAVVVAMRGFLFTDHLTNQHPDILAQWLPRYCYLGQSLVAGRIPQWNPYQMAGMPYASDPQSGWLYLPAMLLFAVAPCSRALGLFIAIQPLMAGLGLWWFLRREGLSRTAATAGGLSTALLVGGSSVGVSLPFAAMVAWTPLMLVGASGYLSAAWWPGRLAWLALAALAWGQVASAHLSHGLLMSSLVLVLYLAVRGVTAVRSGEWTAARAAVLFVGLIVFLPLANAAVLHPRLDLIPFTSLRSGYDALGARLARVAGVSDRPIATHGLWSAWPLNLGSTPGAYAGAVVLLAIPGALWARGRPRTLAVTFGVAGLLAYLLTIDALVGREWFRNAVMDLPLGDVYLHNPGRLRYLIILVAPVLGAVGLQALMDRPLDRPRAALWVGAGGALFLLLPLMLGARPVRFVILAAGVAAAAPLLLILARPRGERSETRLGRAAAWTIPVVLAVELLASVVTGQLYRGGTVGTGLEPPSQSTLAWGPLRWPTSDASEYLARGPFVEAIDGQDGRYLTWYPPAAFFGKGYLFTQRHRDWPSLANSRGMLHSIPDAQGYSPVQLSRYWSYVRATNPVAIFYNAAHLGEPALSDLRLLGVRYLIAPSHVTPRLAGRKVASDRGFDLWEVRGHQRRTSVVPTWHHVEDPAVVLINVLQPSFDPREVAIVENNPGIGREVRARSGDATYLQVSPEEAIVEARAFAPSLVVIRNAWDRNWTATVDGRPAEVLRADYFIQAVPVEAGHHEIRLVYHDPALFRGLVVSGAIWAALVVALVAGIALPLVRRVGRSAQVPRSLPDAGGPSNRPDGGG
jgi:Bacterial membrane protein YfhO